MSCIVRGYHSGESRLPGPLTRRVSSALTSSFVTNNQSRSWWIGRKPYSLKTATLFVQLPLCSGVVSRQAVGQNPVGLNCPVSSDGIVSGSRVHRARSPARGSVLH